jgi:hypothetical protein
VGAGEGPRDGGEEEDDYQEDRGVDAGAVCYRSALALERETVAAQAGGEAFGGGGACVHKSK